MSAHNYSDNWTSCGCWNSINWLSSSLKQRSQEALLPQTDRATLYVSRYLSTAATNNRVRAFPDDRRVTMSGHDALTAEKCRQQVRLTTWSTCLSEMFQIQSLGQISRGKYAYFWRYLNILITQCRIRGRIKEASVPKTSSICPVVSISIQYRLVTDRRTDGRIDI